MKTETEIKQILESNYKTVEKELGIKIRNGQTRLGINKALLWVLK